MTFFLPSDTKLMVTKTQHSSEHLLLCHGEERKKVMQVWKSKWFLSELCLQYSFINHTVLSPIIQIKTLIKLWFDSAFNIIELNIIPVAILTHIQWTPSGFTASPQICSQSLFIQCHHISVNNANLHFSMNIARWREFRLDWASWFTLVSYNS